MPDSFDAYYKWLGISPEEQPPDHYRLLGLRTFEADMDVIEGATDRQMAHVRSFQTGPHAVRSQSVLNELSAAKLCLLNPSRKAVYDQTLRDKLDAQQHAASQPDAPLSPVSLGTPPPALATDFRMSDPFATATRKRPRKKSNRLPLIVGGLSIVGCIGAASLVIGLFSGRAATDRKPADSTHTPTPSIAQTPIPATGGNRVGIDPAEPTPELSALPPAGSTLDSDPAHATTADAGLFSRLRG